MFPINNPHGRLKMHWGRVTHICVSKIIIIGSDNGLSPGRRQAIIWTNAGILLIGPLGTNFCGTSIEIHTFSLKNAPENVVWKMAAILSRPQFVNAQVHVVSIGLFTYRCPSHRISDPSLGIPATCYGVYLLDWCNSASPGTDLKIDELRASVGNRRICRYMTMSDK